MACRPGPSSECKLTSGRTTRLCELKSNYWPCARQEEAELEWDRQLREAAYRRDAQERELQQPVTTDAFAPAQITRTTAEPRPNAYIPDDIGIPKPYGELQHRALLVVLQSRIVANTPTDVVTRCR